jgi:mRNA-degrading endonuclease RelE of RelBE toxin-antitoxin system
MIWKLVYRPFVKQDLQKAIQYYQVISPNLAKDFLNRVREAEKYISQNPYGDDVMYRQIRMHNLKQFPYQIHFFVDDESKKVVILAIAFSKRENLNFSDR